MNRIKNFTICLNMIVKDESKIIERCLKSVIPFIDFFVIMDTGSKDDTMRKIKKIFDQHNKGVKKDQKIKGILFKGEFKNFSHARNHSLSVAYDKCRADYILLMDADHILVFPEKSELEVKINLSKEKDIGSFYITQIDEKLEYKNTRLIRNLSSSPDNSEELGRYYYKGYTHEVLIRTSEDGEMKEDKKITLSVSDIFIQDLGDGGSKEDKSSRDERLLLQEIKEIESSSVNYSRPYFYLANTYFGQKKLGEAEKYYKKRIFLGGWKEELWYCYHKLGLIKVVEKDIPQAIYFLQSAIETNYQRLETYFHLLLILRDVRMDYNFQIYLQRATEILEKIKLGEISTRDFLFYEKEIVVNFEKEFKT